MPGTSEIKKVNKLDCFLKMLSSKVNLKFILCLMTILTVFSSARITHFLASCGVLIPLLHTEVSVTAFLFTPVHSSPLILPVSFCPISQRNVLKDLLEYIKYSVIFSFVFSSKHF